MIRNGTIECFSEDEAQLERWRWKIRLMNTVEIMCEWCHGLCEHLPEWADPREWRD